MAASPQRWLILAHAFNMDGRAASQTITDKMPHLLAAGIEPVVLSGALGRQDAHLEHHQLWPWGPAGIRFELRHVLRDRWGKGLVYRVLMVLASLVLLPGVLLEKLLFPYESAWSWRYAALKRAKALHRQRPFDVIYSTGGAYAAHLAACDFKHATAVRWLAEVHDPFVTPGRHPRTPHEIMKCKVEARIASHADVALWFTEAALASARARQPQLADRGHVILPGSDNPFAASMPDYKPGPKLVLGHFGSLSQTRSLMGVIRALDVLRQHEPTVFQDLILQVTGGALDPASQAYLARSPLKACLDHVGRIEADPVTGVSGRVQILRRMRASDVLLLIHGQEPICAEYIPSKLYEYLWMRRPVLAQVHGNPQMTHMLTALGHRTVETGGDAPDEVRAWVDAIRDLHQRWRTTGLPDLAVSSPYSTQAAVHQLLRWVNAVYPHMMQPVLSIVVLGFRQFARTTGPCLESLRPWMQDPELEFIVVDNGSPDESGSQTAQWCEAHPTIQFLCLPENLGFAGGMNAGAALAKGEWLLLVNNDTLFPAHALDALKRVVREAPSDHAMLGPVTNAAGNGQRLWWPQANVQAWLQEGAWLNQHPTHQLMPAYRCDFFCIAIRRSVWQQLGGLDTAFGLGYYEDFEFSLRVRKAGWQQAITEDVFVLHVGSATFQATPEAKALIRRNKKLLQLKHPDARFEHTREGNWVVLKRYADLVKSNAWTPALQYRARFRFNALREDRPRSVWKRVIWHLKTRHLSALFPAGQ